MAVEKVTLTDPATGCSAKVLVGFGFNCYSFQAVHDGGPLETIWSVPNFDSGQERASSSGIPLLFPFPGRIGGAKYEWQGKTYSLDAGDGRGNAIHGFVFNRPWQLVEQTETHVVGRFQASVDDPSVLNLWPADFCLTARYEVSGNSLKAAYRIENPNDKPLPCGFGTHPYFRVPLGGNNAADCSVSFPVGEIWELRDMLPVTKLTLGDPVMYQRGLNFADMQLDDVFQGLQFTDGVCYTSVFDSNSGRKLTMTFNDVFRALVVYNPRHREAVCIEPYTCVPDPFRLTSEGHDAGLRILQPGEAIDARVDISVE